MGCKRWAVVVVLTGVLAVVPAAGAREYTVTTCGAAGVNNAWAPSTSTFGADPAPYYVFDSTCAGGLQVTSKPQDGLRAPWLTSGGWRFEAPPQTRIVGVQGTRYAEVRDDRTENGADDDHWQVSLLDGAGNRVGGAFGGESCAHGNGVPLCTVGSPGGTAGPAHQLSTTRLTWGVTCAGEITDGCQTSFGIPLAALTLHAITVTLADETAPTAGLEAAEDRWLPASAPLAASGADATGIRTLRLLVDGQETARADQPCDGTKPVPCPATAAAPLAPGAAVRPGSHRVAVEAADAAGNVTEAVRTLRLDPAAPVAGPVSVTRRAIAVRLADDASGVASARLSVRAGDTWRPLATTLRGGRARATGARLRGKAIRLEVADKAGNTATGELARLDLRSAGRAVPGRGTRVRIGRGTALTGRLRGHDGGALAGRPLQLAAREHRSGAAFTALPATTTDARGRFTVRLPAGVSRVLRIGIGGGAPQRADVLVGTRAASSIAVADRTIRRGGTARLSGRLRLAGAAVPPSGKLIDLQGFSRGEWRTFGTARARGPRGRWSAAYDFEGAGTFRLRVRIRREAAFPFELGYSKPVRVRVG